MLTSSDLASIEKLFGPKLESIDKKIDRNERSNQRRHVELQNSINIIVDALGEDVDNLKKRTGEIEKHLGFVGA